MRSGKLIRILQKIDEVVGDVGVAPPRMQTRRHNASICFRESPLQLSPPPTPTLGREQDFYHPPTKLPGGNVFTRVRLSVPSGLWGRMVGVLMWPLPWYIGPHTLDQTSDMDPQPSPAPCLVAIFRHLFIWGRIHPPPPTHPTSTDILWPYSWQAGVWMTLQYQILLRKVELFSQYIQNGKGVTTVSCCTIRVFLQNFERSIVFLKYFERDIIFNRKK